MTIGLICYNTMATRYNSEEGGGGPIFMNY